MERVYWFLGTYLWVPCSGHLVVRVHRFLDTYTDFLPPTCEFLIHRHLVKGVHWFLDTYLLVLCSWTSCRGSTRISWGPGWGRCGCTCREVDPVCPVCSPGSRPCPSRTHTSDLKNKFLEIFVCKSLFWIGPVIFLPPATKLRQGGRKNGNCSWRYASYWNALFDFLSVNFIVLTKTSLVFSKFRWESIFRWSLFSFGENILALHCQNFCVRHLCYCICLTSLTCAKCGTRSTLCWKILNISDSTELFAL